MSVKNARELALITILSGVAAVIMLRGGFWAPAVRAPVEPPVPPIARSPQMSYTAMPVASDVFVGQLPPGLIAEEGIVAEQSRKTTDADGTSLISGTYISSESLQWNIDTFGAYFESAGWSVQHAANASGKPIFFYAVKDGETLNITLALVDSSDPENKTIRASIAYSEK